MDRLRIVDSHTGGEPTRVVPIGEIDVRGVTMLERRHDLKTRLDHLRTGLVLEPRGSEVIVGAILTPPEHPDSIAGVVFCNNAGYLGMCGHGSIGVIETLRYLGTIGPGCYRLDTPAGTVSATLLENGQVEIENVPAYLYRQGVQLQLDTRGLVVGDVVYGGNWFFIVETQMEISLANRQELDLLCKEIKQALVGDGITGKDDAEIDHVELSKKLCGGESDAVNYVMCPGGEYDRSPCGTGTSAKVASLIEKGKLEPNQWFIQESVTGTIFRSKAEIRDGQIIPTVVGQAFVVADGHLLFSEKDPLQWGFQ